MASRKRLLCLATLIGLTFPRLENAESHTTNWRVWNTADGMRESYISQLTRTPSGKIIARHGDVSTMTVIDGLHLSKVPDPKSLGLVYENDGGEFYTFGPSGMLVYSNSRWREYPLPDLWGKANFGIFRTFRWFEYPMAPERDVHVDAVPASGDRAIILASRRLVEWSRSTGAVRQLLTERSAGIGEFLKISPGYSRTFFITGSEGLGILNEDGAWTKVQGAAGYSHFWFPSFLQSGEILVSARTNSGSHALLIHSSGGWREIYRGGQNVRGWEASGRIWIIDDARLFVYENGLVLPVRLPPEISGKLIDAVSDGRNFWLGTTQGLARYTPSLWQTPREARPIADIVNAIAQDREGRLWFASGRNLLTLDHGRWSRIAMPPEAQQGTGKTGAVCPLDDGTILISPMSMKFLLKLNPKTGSMVRIVHPGGREIIWVERRDGRSIWVETMRPGDESSRLEIYDGAFHPVPGGEVLPTTDLRAILQVKDGSIWAGGTGALVRIVNGKMQR
ncbi:MAG: hypothetical protein KGN84_11175, partial [Acidobacteriota bacterium]|nr:hypothetical protein [Acidobacteriota bacterium]